MTRHQQRWPMVLLGLLVVSAGSASAQSPRPVYGGSSMNRPGLSPYLNLIRGGDPAANYYLGVIPEQQRRFNAYQTRSALQDLEARTARPTEDANDALTKPLNQTGHAVGFGNQLGYFGR